MTKTLLSHHHHPHHQQHQHHLSLPTGVEPNVQKVLDNLTEEELEWAARTVYEYVQHPRSEWREYYASLLCQRYLKSKKGDIPIATRKVKETIAFRKKERIEELMTVMERQPDSETAQSLQYELKDRTFYVQGYDKDGRSTLYFIPRRMTHFDKVWHLKSAIYSIERAMACSQAYDRTINVIVDFSGFSLYKHSPPLDVGKEFLLTLRNHYAGQTHKILLLDCPPSFHILWNIFSSFVGTETRSKLEFLSTVEQKMMTTSNLYDIDELPPFVHPKGGMVRELDIDEYLHRLQFDQAFGDEII